MLGRRVVFLEKGKVCLEAFDIGKPSPAEILVETVYGVISPGTERANLLANQTP